MLPKTNWPTEDLQRNDFNMRIGQSKLKSGQLFVNSEFDITSGIRGYAFGGYSYRDGNAAGFFRRPNQSRTLTSVFLTDSYQRLHPQLPTSLCCGI